MKSDEKGASKYDLNRSLSQGSRREKFLKKTKEESSASKNTSILDFLGNGKDSLGLSRQKRKRSPDEDENLDSENEEPKKKGANRNTGTRQVVNLLDDSFKDESDSKIIIDINSTSPAKNKKSNNSSIIDLHNESMNSDTKKEKVKKNRINCSICRTGGNLILCDNCPKSFHLECLKMKSTEIPDGDWYCPGCQPLIEKRKKRQESTMTLDEKKIQKREKRRLYRLKKKEESKTGMQSSSTKMISLSAKKKSRRLGKSSTISKLSSEVKNLTQLNFSQINGKTIGNLNNPHPHQINLILAETENKLYPLIPLVSDEVQSKMLEEKSRMQEFLFNKLKSKGASIVTTNGKLTAAQQGNKSIDSFFNSVNRSKDKIIDLTDNSDLSQEEYEKKHNSSKCSMNIIPTDEEAREVLNKLTQGKMIDLIALKQLDQTNPILYAKVHNMYLESLKQKQKQRSINKEELTKQNQSNQGKQQINVNPQPVVKKNVKFPIDDTELYKYPEAYSLGKQFLEKPIGSKPLIPNEHLTKIFKIWDFMHSFKNKLNISEFSPEQLYFALNHFSEEEIPLITEIHSAFIHSIGEQLVVTEYSVLMNNDEYELTLLKILIENHSAPKRFIYKKTWVDILRIVLTSKMFEMMITEDLSKLAERLKYHDSRNYNMLSYEEKMMLLEYLLNTVIGLDYIRDTIKSDMENRAELNKEKVGITNELRMIESRKREIERQEKFTKPKEKVDALNNRINTLVEDNPNLNRQQLFKLRKELESEREVFRSVIKEAEEIETNRTKIIARIDKITAEMREIPSTNKKLIGLDGFRNEYYFFPHQTTKLYLKRIVHTGSRKSYEWREFTQEEEIKELLTKLSEKGINEMSLIMKLNKLFPKRLKLKKSNAKDNIVSNSEDKMVVDDESNLKNASSEENPTSKEILKSALEWKNLVADKFNKKFENSDSYEEISQRFNDLEEQITDYFYQDDKEWEAYDVRQNFKAWLNMTQNVQEFAKAILMFNFRFKNPYKINDTGNKSKIIEDEDDQGEMPHTILKPDYTLDPFVLNPKRALAPKARLWSRELEGMDEFFVKYVNDVKSIPSLFLGFFIFESIFYDLVKRREIYKKKSKDAKDTNSNNFDDDNSNMSSSNRDPISESKNKKVDLDEFYYDEKIYSNEIVVDVESSYNSNQVKNSKNNINNISGNNIATSTLFNEPSSRTRSRRPVNNNNNTNNNKLSNSNISTKKKTIDWNDNCYICEESGEVLCCEDCPNVAHLFCVELKKEPEEWRCENCIYKLANKRMTRSSKL